MMTLKLKITLLAAFAGFAATQSQAADRTWVGGTGNWNDGAKWTSGSSMPGSTDTAILNSGGVATINSNVGMIADTIGCNNSNNILINMESGGSLIVTDTYEMGRSKTGNTTFNMTGGSFTAGRMFLTQHNTGTNQLTISGGTFDVTGALGMLDSAGWANSGTHTLTVSGDDASISAGSVNMINGYGANSMATTLEFDFDSDGISTMNVDGAFTAGNNSLLEIDLANYTGTGTNTFTLVNSTALTAFGAGNITVLNAGDYSYTVSQDVGDDITITVTGDAPPPAAGADRLTDVSYFEGLVEGAWFTFGDHLFRWDRDSNGNEMMDLGEVSESDDDGASWAVITSSSDFGQVIGERRSMRFEPQQAFVYKRTETRDLKLFVHYPDDWQPTDNRPAILWFHGGGFAGGGPGQFEQQAAYFTERGIVNIRVAYRLVITDGVSGSGFPATMDGRSAIRWVRQNAAMLGVDVNKVLAGGNSAGGGLAIAAWRDDINDPNDDLTIDAKPNAFVCESPWIKVANEAAKPSSYAWPVITNSPPPMFMAFGTSDSGYDAGGTLGGEQFVADCISNGVDVTTYLVEGAGHGFGMGVYFTPCTTAMDDFLVAHGYLTGSANVPARLGRTLTYSELNIPEYAAPVNNASLVETVTVPLTVDAGVGLPALSVQFAYAMDTATFAAGLVVSNLTSGATVQGSWSNTSGNEYTFVPTSGYIAENEYALTFSTSLQDIDANAQVFEQTANFYPLLAGSGTDDVPDVWARLGVTDALPGGTVVYDATADWSSRTVADINNVLILNGATVTLDQTDTAAMVRVNEGAALTLDQSVNLTAESLQVGAWTGAGTVNQSAGTVTTPTLAISSFGASNASVYNLTGGTLSGPDELPLNTNGILLINGGTANFDITGAGWPGYEISGDGLLKVQAGTFALDNGGSNADYIEFKANVEVSGGSVDVDGQSTFRGEYKVVGSGASIYHQIISGASGATFKFVLDASGVSPITSFNRASISGAKLEVDGSAYSGGAGTIVLFDAGFDLNGVTDSSNITVTGFDGRGLIATVEQDQEAEEVRLVVELAYDTWADAHGLTGNDALPGTDVEPDGLDNLMEYALGGDPTMNDAASIAPVSYTADAEGSRWFYYAYNERTDDLTLTYTLGTKTDLADPAVWDTDDMVWVSETAASGGIKTVTYRATASTASKFVKLFVEQ